MGRVLVAGSINMDVVVVADRHPKIGETIAGREVKYFPGGKGANQAVAAARLGAATSLIGRIGRDAFGRELRAFLEARDIDLTFVLDTPEAHSGTALITLARADNTIVVVPGANGLVTASDVAAAPLARGDVAISQFEIPISAIQAFFERARKAGATTILNPAPANPFEPSLLNLVDILVLNETELALLGDIRLGEFDENARYIEAMRALPIDENKIVCVTLGRRGAIVMIDGDPVIIAGRSVTAVDTTGAGDCFVGALAAQLACGNAIRDALVYANIAASLCVQRMGAAPSMPDANEVRSAVRSE